MGRDINPSIGGNFSYHDKLIRVIDNYEFDKQLEICFVGRVSGRKIKFKKEYFKLAPWTIYVLFRAFDKFYITHFFSRLFFTNSDICNRIDCFLLKKKKVDILLFPSNSYGASGIFHSSR